MTPIDIPTKEQMMEFWEQHGLHHNKPTGGFFWDEGCNLVFDMHKGETGINLDILFRYAVSKYRSAHDEDAVRMMLVTWVKKLVGKSPYANYPALALFLVLQQAQRK